MRKILRNVTRQDTWQETFTLDPALKLVEGHFATTIMAEKRQVI